MYIVVVNPLSNFKIEMPIYMKQATQVLMYCRNDFKKFISEMLTLKNNKLVLKDINQVILDLTDQNLMIKDAME